MSDYYSGSNPGGRLLRAAFWASILIIFGLGVALLPSVAAQNPSFLLKASFRGWNDGEPGGANPVLTVVEGDSVTVTIEWVNSIHNWALYPGGTPPNQVGFGDPDAIVRTEDVTSGQPTASVTFTISQPGTYEYYCEYHPTSMHGQLVVIASNAPPALVLNAPPGGVSWSGGSSHDVSLDVTDDEPASNLTVWVNYSHNGGATGGPIAVLAPPGPNPNVLSWILPVIDASDARINVTARDGRGSFSYLESPIFEIDSTAPTISDRVPGPDAMGVAPSAQVRVTWSEGMNESETARRASFGVVRLSDTTWLEGTVSWSADSRQMTFTPDSLLDPSTTYRVHVNGTARDDSDPGNALATPSNWTFVTSGAADTRRPTIASVAANPTSQVAGGFVNITARVTDDRGVDSVTLHVTGPATDVNLTMTRGSSSTWFLNRTYLQVGTYSFTIWATDTAGNVASQSSSFAIVADVEPTPSDFLVPTAILLVILIAILTAGLIVWRRRRSRGPGEGR